MFEFFESIDSALFRFFNGTISNPVFDWLMPFVTDQDRWVIPMILLAVAGLVIGDNRTRLMVLGAAVIVGLTDWISSGLLKPMVGRIRPCHDLTILNLLVNCGGKYSFPSGHATNMFGLAAWFGYHRGNWKLPLIGFASLIALSRVYVGVHWPMDVITGAMLGFGVGTLMTAGWGRIERWYAVKNES